MKYENFAIFFSRKQPLYIHQKAPTLVQEISALLFDILYTLRLKVHVNNISVLAIPCIFNSRYQQLLSQRYEPLHVGTSFHSHDMGSVRGNFTNGAIGSQWYH